MIGRLRLRSFRHGDAEGDGKRGRGPDPGRTEPDRDLGRVGQLPGRRRIPGPAAFHDLRRRVLCTPTITFKKFGISLELHAGRYERRSHQPEGLDRSVGAFEREFDHHQTALTIAVDQDPPRRHHARNSLRRIDGDGRPDQAADQAGHQRPARHGADSGARIAVPQPRLRQQQDRTDGAGHALHRARGRAEGSVAPGRRLRRRFRTRRPTCSAASTGSMAFPASPDRTEIIAAPTVSSPTKAGQGRS